MKLKNRLAMIRESIKRQTPEINKKIRIEEIRLDESPVVSLVHPVRSLRFLKTAWAKTTLAMTAIAIGLFGIVFLSDGGFRLDSTPEMAASLESEEDALAFTAITSASLLKYQTSGMDFVPVSRPLSGGNTWQIETHLSQLNHYVNVLDRMIGPVSNQSITDLTSPRTGFERAFRVLVTPLSGSQIAYELHYTEDGTSQDNSYVGVIVAGSSEIHFEASRSLQGTREWLLTTFLIPTDRSDAVKARLTEETGNTVIEYEHISNGILLSKSVLTLTMENSSRKAVLRFVEEDTIQATFLLEKTTGLRIEYEIGTQDIFEMDSMIAPEFSYDVRSITEKGVITVGVSTHQDSDVPVLRYDVQIASIGTRSYILEKSDDE